MRSHPIAGSFFILIGIGLLLAGAMGQWPLPKGIPGPLPSSIIIPFVFWQLAVWSLLFGAFFFRGRGRIVRRESRFTF